MADEQDNSGVAVAEPEDQGYEDQGRKDDLSGKSGEIFKKPRIIFLGRPFFGSSSISRVSVNGKDVPQNGLIRLKPGDEVNIAGGGLAGFSEWKFFQKGKTGKQIPKAIDQDKSVVFRIPDWEFYFGPKEGVLLVFSKKGSAQIWGVPVAFYFGKVESEEGKKGKAEGGKEGKAADEAAGAAGGGMGVLTQAVGDTITGVVSPFIPYADRIAKRNELKEALKSGDKKKISSLTNQLKASGDVEGLREAAKVSSKEHVKLINNAIYEASQAKISTGETAVKLDEIATSIDVTDVDVGGEIRGEVETEATADISGEVSAEIQAADEVSGRVEGEVLARPGAAAAEAKVGDAARVEDQVSAGVGGQAVGEEGEIKIKREGVMSQIPLQAQGKAGREIGAQVRQEAGAGKVSGIAAGVDKAGLAAAGVATGAVESQTADRFEVPGERRKGKVELGADSKPVGESRAEIEELMKAKGVDVGKVQADEVTAADTLRGDIISQASGKASQEQQPPVQKKRAAGAGIGGEADLAEEEEPEKEPEGKQKAEVKQERSSEAGGEGFEPQLEELKKRDKDLRRAIPSVVVAGGGKEEEGEKPEEEPVAEGKQEPSKKEPEVKQKLGPFLGAKHRPQAAIDSVGPKGQAPGLGSKMPEGGPVPPAPGDAKPQAEAPIGPPLSSEELAKKAPGEKGEGPKKPGDGLGKTDYDHLLPEQQKRDLEASRQKDWQLTESQKAKIEEERAKQVAKKASMAMNKALTQAAYWVWGSAIPSFGLSVLLGAIVGDFLWAFKNWLIEKFLNPLLKTEKLKSMAKEIAKDIKFSVQVKLHIVAMNLVVVLIIGLIVLLFYGIIWWACQDWGGRGVLYLTGYDDVCEYIDSNSFGFGGGDSGGGGTSDSWGSGTGKCSPALSGVASVASLAGTCFGSNAYQASSIAFAESGGDPSRSSGVDKCQPGGEAVSWGLFQINISAHKIGNLDCPAAFDKMYTGSNHSCKIVNQSLYNQCVQVATNAQANIQLACQISGNGSNWSAWGANQKCGF